MAGISAALVLALLVSAGCSKSGRSSSGGKNMGKITGSSSDPPVAFQAQWGPSNRYVFRSEMTMSSQLPRQGRDKPDPQESTLGLDYVVTVSNLRSNGSRTVQLEIASVQFESMMRDTQLINYDSLNKVIGTDGNQMAERLERIIGSKMTFQVSVSNKISNIKGVNEIINALYGGGNPRGERLVQRLFTAQFLRHLIDVIVLPSDPVKINDSWPGQITVNAGPLSGGTATADVTYTFLGWQVREGRKCAVFEFKGTLKPARGGGSKSITSTIEKGEITGRTWFDPELGMIVGSVSDQTVLSKGTIRWNRAPTNAPPQNFTSETRQHADVKLIEVETPKPSS